MFPNTAKAASYQLTLQNPFMLMRVRIERATGAGRPRATTATRSAIPRDFWMIFTHPAFPVAIRASWHKCQVR